MEDYNILNSSGIQNNSILYFKDFQHLKGAGPMEFYLPDDLCDPQYDYDFRNINDSQKFYRGGYEYKRPCGWLRYGLKVKGKFENDEWIEGKNEWAYHGTKVDNIESILKNGFRVGPGNVFGNGVYSTPDISIAEFYSSLFTSPTTGKQYKIVLQNRVKPSAIVDCSNMSSYSKDYWLVKDGKDIRAYSICVKEF